jgi:hypothetical protein
MPRLILVVFLAVAVAACGNSLSSTTPTTPTPVTQTDTFSGTLNPNGAATHTFVTGTSGAIIVTLTSIAPDSTIVVGLSLGTWNGNACQTVLAKDNAIQGSTVTGSASQAGNLCVRIYDVGRITDPIAYQIDTIHP